MVPPLDRRTLRQQPHVVIVGAGFAGMEVAKALERTRARVTVVDRHNHNLFQPLLYQVATAALSPAEVAVPIRALLHGPNMEMLLDEVIGVDVERARVRTSGGCDLGFDFLVLATGSEFNYFGHDDWASIAPGPKTIEDAEEIRNRLLLAFERAEMCEDDAERRALMTFVIVGAGATGVEMAGAIAELAKAALRRDFRRIDPAAARILLVEAGARVLAEFPETLGAYAQRALGRLGVEILLNTKIDHVDRDGIVASERRIAARTVIWGAGARATPVAAWLGVPPGLHGAVEVAPDFSIAGIPTCSSSGTPPRREIPTGSRCPAWRRSQSRRACMSATSSDGGSRATRRRPSSAIAISERWRRSAARRRLPT